MLNKSIELLNNVMEGLLKINALCAYNPNNTQEYLVKATIELDSKSYNTFLREFSKEYEGGIDSICYCGFQFSIKKIDTNIEQQVSMRNGVLTQSLKVKECR